VWHSLAASGELYDNKSSVCIGALQSVTNDRLGICRHETRKSRGHVDDFSNLMLAVQMKALAPLCRVDVAGDAPLSAALWKGTDQRQQSSSNEGRDIAEWNEELEA